MEEEKKQNRVRKGILATVLVGASGMLGWLGFRSGEKVVEDGISQSSTEDVRSDDGKRQNEEGLVAEGERQVAKTGEEQDLVEEEQAVLEEKPVIYFVDVPLEQLAKNLLKYEGNTLIAEGQTLSNEIKENGVRYKIPTIDPYGGADPLTKFDEEFRWGLSHNERTQNRYDQVLSSDLAQIRVPSKGNGESSALIELSDDDTVIMRVSLQGRDAWFQQSSDAAEAILRNSNLNKPEYEPFQMIKDFVTDPDGKINAEAVQAFRLVFIMPEGLLDELKNKLESGDLERAADIIRTQRAEPLGEVVTKDLYQSVKNYYDKYVELRIKEARDNDNFKKIKKGADSGLMSLFLIGEKALDEEAYLPAISVTSISKSFSTEQLKLFTTLTQPERHALRESAGTREGDWQKDQDSRPSYEDAYPSIEKASLEGAETKDYLGDPYPFHVHNIPPEVVQFIADNEDLVNAIRENPLFLTFLIALESQDRIEEALDSYSENIVVGDKQLLLDISPQGDSQQLNKDLANYTSVFQAAFSNDPVMGAGDGEEDRFVMFNKLPNKDRLPSGFNTLKTIAALTGVPHELKEVIEKAEQDREGHDLEAVESPGWSIFTLVRPEQKKQTEKPGGATENAQSDTSQGKANEVDSGRKH